MTMAHPNLLARVYTCGHACLQTSYRHASSPRSWERLRGKGPNSSTAVSPSVINRTGNGSSDSTLPQSNRE